MGKFDPDHQQVGESIVYINGEFLPESQARISVFDHGLLYGDGVFDTSCAWNGYIFMLEEHLDRLYRSIHAAKIDFDVDKAQLQNLIIETVRRNQLNNAYIKVVVSRGVSPEPLLDPRNCVTSLIIFARPYLSLADPAKATLGLSAKVVSTRRVPHSSIDPKIKSLNYLNIVLAKIEAIESGCDEAIMLDTDGYVCEGPGYNIFLVDRGVLCTPKRGILEGITRDVVFTIGDNLGFDTVADDYTPYDLYNAEEVFFCSTAGGIIPIVEIDGRTVGTGSAGPLTQDVRTAYQNMLENGERGTAIYDRVTSESAAGK